MDVNGRSLLNLLGRNEQSLTSQDQESPVLAASRDENLLALFGARPPTESLRTPTQPKQAKESPSKNAHASDLLAALMGTSSTRTPPSRTSIVHAETTESLLSSLLSANSHQHTKDSYLPKKFPMETAQADVVSPPSRSGSAGSATSSKDLRPTSTVRAPTSSSTGTEQTPESMQVSLNRITAQPEALDKSESSVDVQVGGVEKGDSREFTNLLLPHNVASMYRIAADLPLSNALLFPQPLTRMAVRYDSLSRNIIAATHRYFAYPVSKDGSIGGIRIVDQETGSTIVIEHSSACKVINLCFARQEDDDGQNFLISTDTQSGHVVWSIDSSMKTRKLTEIMGPSDASHKSRARWNQQGTVFGISLTSRLYIFEMESISKSSKFIKIKLTPGVRHCSNVCKTDKAIKDFAFAPDSSAIFGVDKSCVLRMWLPDQTTNTIESIRNLSLGNRPLLSIEMLTSRILVVGTHNNETIFLVDLRNAKIIQEIQLPKSTENQPFAMQSRMCLAKNYLIINNEQRQSIFVMALEPIELGKEVQFEKTSDIVKSINATAGQSLDSGMFSKVFEFNLPDSKNQRFLSFTTVSLEHDIELFVAHSRGYTSYRVGLNDLKDSARIASKTLDTSCISKLESQGEVLVVESAQKETGIEKRDSAKIRLPSPSAGAQQVRAKARPDYASDPAGAVGVDDSPLSFKNIITAELRKSDAANKVHLEKLQKSNDSRHEAILRLVSETLSTNTAGVLSAVVKNNVERTLVPELKKSLSDTISSQLTEAVMVGLKPLVLEELPKITGEFLRTAIEQLDLPAQVEAAFSSLQGPLLNQQRETEKLVADALLRIETQHLESQKDVLMQISLLHESMKILKAELVASKAEAAAQSAQPSLQSQISTPLLPAQQPGVLVPSKDEVHKYHELIMEFVSKTQALNAGDSVGLSFVRQFLSWQPPERMKAEIVQSLASDQLQLLAFIHALVSNLTEIDAFNRVHWMHVCIPFLAVDRDRRLDLLGPRLFDIIRDNLQESLLHARPSTYKQLVESTLASLPILKMPS